MSLLFYHILKVFYLDLDLVTGKPTAEHWARALEFRVKLPLFCGREHYHSGNCY